MDISIITIRSFAFDRPWTISNRWRRSNRLSTKSAVDDRAVDETQSLKCKYTICDVDDLQCYPFREVRLHEKRKQYVAEVERTTLQEMWLKDLAKHARTVDLEIAFQ